MDTKALFKLEVIQFKKYLINIFDLYPEFCEILLQSVDKILTDKVEIGDFLTIKKGLEFISNFKGLDLERFEFISDQITSFLNAAITHYDFNEKEIYQIKLELVDEYINCSKMYSYHGLTGAAYDYLVKAFNFGTIPEGLYHLTLDLNFWEQVIEFYKFDFAREILISLCANSFYLCRILGFQYQENHNLFYETFKWINTRYSSTIDDIEYMCLYAGLIVLNDNEENRNTLHPILKKQYDFEIANANNVSAILITRTMASKFGLMMGEDPCLWSERGLIFKDEMAPEDIASLELTILFRDNTFDEEAIHNVLLSYLEFVMGNHKSVIMNFQQRMRMSELINRTVKVSIEKGRYSFGIKCVMLWRSFLGDEIKYNNNELFVLACPAFSDDKVIYILDCNGKTTFLEYTRNISLKEFLSIKNEFEGTWTVFAHDQTPLSRPRRHIPIENMSSEYETAIKDFFAIEEIGKELSKIDIDKNVKVLEVPWTNTPFVSYLSYYVNRSISVYVQNKIKHLSEIKKVLLWCNPDSTLSAAKLEQEALEYILKANNIEYEVFTGNECSKLTFENKYKDSSFDLIWLMCHGNFNFDNPYQSNLKISSTDHINVLELERLTPERINRRLLVLNACQSGTSSIRYDSMGFTGLGPSLTNINQSVIGHLWLAESFAASIIGTVLMGNLILNSEHGIALNNTLHLITQDKNTVINHLTRLLNEESQIVRSLSERNIDLQKIIYWGSLVHFD
ncbi:CHAT domain-containing protein [Neobacillus drentensis]|uniref:CHAT domain-containing protein n=1 Tax=Neobacillus drentensis TaxID=220684 RepID=UPI002FFF737F